MRGEKSDWRTEWEHIVCVNARKCSSNGVFLSSVPILLVDKRDKGIDELANESKEKGVFLT